MYRLGHSEHGCFYYVNCFYDQSMPESVSLTFQSKLTLELFSFARWDVQVTVCTTKMCERSSFLFCEVVDSCVSAGEYLILDWSAVLLVSKYIYFFLGCLSPEKIVLISAGPVIIIIESR